MAAPAPGREFERVVRDAMDAADLSLSALARESGIERGRWYSWFRADHVPQRRSLIRAAHALNVDVSGLLEPWGDMAGTGSDTTQSVPAALIEAMTAQTEAITELVARLDQLLPSEKVREMLAWAAEQMPAESPSPSRTPDHDGSPARS